MDLIDFIPFRNEMAKMFHGLTDNATHTSEKPIFNELRVRRYEKQADVIAEFILDKIEHWVGWSLKNDKTAVGGMRSIRAEVSSFALLGMKIDVAFGLLQETDVNGRPITTVNGKAHTRIDSKGDLGESRRMLRMILSALDFEFRKQIIREDDYLFRSTDPKGSSSAFQHVFDESKLEHRPSSPKAKEIEFKKPSRQAIPYKPSRPADSQPEPDPARQESNGSEAPAVDMESPQPSKPKITVISLKK